VELNSSEQFKNKYLDAILFLVKCTVHVRRHPVAYFTTSVRLVLCVNVLEADVKVPDTKMV